VDQIVDQMQVRRERYGISYHVISDRTMEIVAPIVARLAGVAGNIQAPPSGEAATNRA
jgi:hypothetical protein